MRIPLIGRMLAANSEGTTITENVVTGNGKGLLFYGLLGAVAVLLGLVIWLLVLNKRYEKKEKETENTEEQE